MANDNLHRAKNVKQDEFYTRLEDIEKEIKYYRSFFNGKIVYCNCDGILKRQNSNFFVYFALNYEYLGLKGLICSGYNPNGRGEKFEFFGDLGDRDLIKDMTSLTIELEGDGSFKSDECLKLLEKCDVVVTNPPFSLFREYVATLMDYDKNFLIIGNQNNVIYKEIFPLFKEDKMWLGVNYGSQEFNVPDDYDSKATYIGENGKKYAKFGNICWFTNLHNVKRSTYLDLYKKYNEQKYPKYDNFNAIEVGRVEDIPVDYEGIMGVPITFLNKYNPEQFEIIWQASGNTRASAPKDVLQLLGYTINPQDRGGCGVVNGKRCFSRVFIRKRQNKKT